MSACEATRDSEFRVPDWTMALDEAVFVGIPLKGPHGNLREPVERFFASVKRSEGTGVPSPEIFKRLIGDISRHYRGKKEVVPLNERVRNFHVEEGQTFSIFCDRFFDLRDDAEGAQNARTPGQYPINLHTLYTVFDVRDDAIFRVGSILMLRGALPRRSIMFFRKCVSESLVEISSGENGSQGHQWRPRNPAQVCVKPVAAPKQVEKIESDSEL